MDSNKSLNEVLKTFDINISEIKQEKLSKRDIQSMKNIINSIKKIQTSMVQDTKESEKTFNKNEDNFSAAEYLMMVLKNISAMFTQLSKYSMENETIERITNKINELENKVKSETNKLTFGL